MTREEKIKELRRQHYASIAWQTLLIQPAAILFIWNVGVASIAHVQTFGAYWPLLAFSLAINLVAAVAATVRQYGR